MSHHNQAFSYSSQPLPPHQKKFLNQLRTYFSSFSSISERKNRNPLLLIDKTYVKLPPKLVPVAVATSLRSRQTVGRLLPALKCPNNVNSPRSAAGTRLETHGTFFSNDLIKRLFSSRVKGGRSGLVRWVS